MRSFKVLGCILFMFAAHSGAQTYPVKPIKLIIPFAAGGPQDAPLRPAALKLGEMLGQPVVIDYKPGAAATIGADYVAKSAPDGYTLLGAAGSFTAAAVTVKNLPYDPVKDFAAISPVGVSPIVLVVNPKMPVTSVKELIAYAKSRPGKLNFGSNGTGASMHLAMELFKMMSGTDMVHIPYKGAGPALLDVVAGACDLMFVSAPIAVPQVNAGKVRLLGVATLQRSVLLPNSPTLVEAGIPKFEAVSMVGILAPAATPRAIVNRLNGLLEKILAMPDIKELFAANGLEPWWKTPEQFATWIREDVERWAAVTRAIKYQPE